ncbi:fimbrial protein [Citrobacter portucalensis]
MKMNVIAMTLSGATILMASNVMAYDGTVVFNGEILDSACTVDIGSSNTLMVDLGRVSKTAFVSTGDEASTTKFTLRLKDCPVSVTSAKVKFDGAHDSNDSSLLAITQSAGSANGVAIRLKTADSMSLGLNQDNGYAYMLSSTADNNLDFYAAYVATLVPVLPGSANAVANFTVNYN